jgi:hypothetical protein
VIGSSIEYNLTVDGQYQSVFYFPNPPQEDVDLYHCNLYNATNLTDDTEHTLFLNVNPIGNGNLAYPNIQLDYMIVTQPVAAAVVQGPNFFDDTDPAFKYSGPWSTGNGSAADMMQTLHSALSLNSSVELTFNGERVPKLPYLAVVLLTSAYAGTYIDVYGRLPMSIDLVSVAEFTVDNGTPFVSDYPPLMDITWDETLATSSNYRLYSNPYLSAGIHTLVIKPQAPNALWLDYAIAGIGPDLINSGDTVTSFPVPPSSTISGVPSPFRSDSSSSSLRQSAHTAEIVGGTAWAICLVLVILGIIYCVRSRQRQRNADSDILVTRRFPLGLRGSTLSCSR